MHPAPFSTGLIVHDSQNNNKTNEITSVLSAILSAQSRPSDHHCEVMSWLRLTFGSGLSLIIVGEEHTAQLINWINI